ncbi:S-layer homology domain-containing protein [Paenibacillus solani]|uniref:S-layer homology domain-containing protein n=1 Tax=Paenibacillus solani TaxID=1705565 RepID=UPI003D2DD9BB
MRSSKMKALLILGLCFSIVLGAFPVLVAAADSRSPLAIPVPLVNSSFDVEVTGEIPGWSVDPATSAFGSATLSSEYTRSGNSSLLFHDKTNGAAPTGHFRVLSDTIPVQTNDTVTFSTYVYKETAADQTAQIQPVIHFYSDDTEITPNAFSTSYPKDKVSVGAWTPVEVEANISDARITHIRVGLYSGFSSLTKLYVDDAVVTINSNPFQLVNPGFEDPMSDPGIPGWATSGTGTAEVSTAQAKSAPGSLHMSSNSAADPLLVESNVFSVNAGEKLNVSLEFFPIALASGFEQQIHYYDANDAPAWSMEKASYIIDQDTASNQWNTLSEQYTVPDHAVKAKIVFSTGESSNSEVFIDDVSITKEMIVTEPQEPIVSLLKNPSFDLPYESNMAIPGWTKVGSGIAELSQTHAKSTPNSLYFLDNSTTTSLRVDSDAFNVTSGDKLSVAFELYPVELSHSLVQQIYYYDGNDKPVGSAQQTFYVTKPANGRITVDANQWNSLMVESVVPEEAVKARIAFNSGGVSTSEVYIDDVAVSAEQSEGPEQEISDDVVNPGFEEELVDGVIPGWSLGFGKGEFSISSEVKFNGEKSLYFKDSSTSDALKVMSNKITATPDHSIIVSAQVYVLQQTHNIVAQVYYYDENDKQLKADEALFSNVSLGSYRWSTMRLYSEAPANAKYLRVFLYSGEISLTEAYFDDISIERLAYEAPLDRQYEVPEVLGDMVNVNLGQAGAVQTNANGDNEAYFVTNGKPGSFFAVDGETGALKFQQVIPNTVATWAMTIGSDKNVYFAGTEDGILYRYIPTEQRIENLSYNGLDSWTWDLEAIDYIIDEGKDHSDPENIGIKVYGGTFDQSAGGKVYEYDTVTKQFRQYGVVDPGQQYVRGIAVDDKYIYAGLGTTRKLFKIDRMTGEKTEIYIPGYSGATETIADVFVHGGKLFVSVSTINMVVMDLDTLEIESTFQYSNMISDPSPSNPNLIYYKYLTKFYQYDISTKTSTEIELPFPLPDTTRVKDMAWIQLKGGEKEGKTVLAMITQYGEYVLIDPSDKWMKFVELDIDSNPVNIQSLQTGFDGRLYMGGYQRGMSIYNPFTSNIDVSISSFAQPEGIGFLNDKAYFGTYVSAIMYSYDPTKEVILNQNPKLEFDIAHQDRPFAITSGDNKLFVGTVPDYGFLGGALVIYDEATDVWTQYDHTEVVKDHSIIGLAYKNGLLYGSTTQWGGLGIDPSEDEAKIFVWDVARGLKIDEYTLDGIDIDEAPRMIGGLSFGPDGLLWGIVDGTIFALDVDTKQVVKSKLIRPSMYNSSKWMPYELHWSPDGLLYTTLARKVVAVDPDTLQYKMVVDTFVNSMTLGIDGSIYYAPNAGTSLSRIAIPQTDATLASLTIDGADISGFSPGILNYKQKASPSAVVAAVPMQSGAVVAIEDQRQAKGKTMIHVLGTDGVSKLTYTITWENTDPVTPNPKPDPSPVTPPAPPITNPTPVAPTVTNPTPVTATTPPVHKEQMVITEQQLKQPGGNAVIQLADGVTEVLLPIHSAEIMKNGQITLVKGDVQAVLTSAALAEMAGKGDTGTAQIAVQVSIMEAADKVAAHNKVKQQPGNAGMKPAGSFVVLSTAVITADGTRYSNSRAAEPIKLQFVIGEKQDAGLLGIYSISDDGKAVYVGGTRNGDVLEALVFLSGTYALLTLEHSYKDVAAGHWAYDAIAVLTAKHIMKGLSDTSFGPSDTLTRAQFTTMLVRAFGISESVDEGRSFSDVKANAWYYDAVQAASKAGLVEGTGGNRFDPNGAITREQMAVMLVRAWEATNRELTTGSDLSGFKDQESISDWAARAMNIAVDQKWMQGKGDGVLAPKALATRAESAQMLLNLFTHLYR